MWCRAIPPAPMKAIFNVLDKGCSLNLRRYGMRGRWECNVESALRLLSLSGLTLIGGLACAFWVDRDHRVTAPSHRVALIRDGDILRRLGKREFQRDAGA